MLACALLFFVFFDFSFSGKKFELNGTESLDEKRNRRTEEKTASSPSLPMSSDHALTSNSSSSVKGCGIMSNYQLHAGPIVGLVQRSNPLSSTEIVGDLKSRLDLEEESKHSNLVALCTLNGTDAFADKN